MPSLSVPRLAIVDGWGPKRDNTGLNTTGTGPEEYRYDGPEVNPYRGFTLQHAIVRIPGSEITGYSYDPYFINGPNAGSIVILWLVTRDGVVSEFGNWEQIGTQNFTGWAVDSLPVDPPIPGIGGWEFIAGHDTGNGGPKVLAYYRIITPEEQERAVTWRIRLTNSGSVFSQVWYNVVRPQCYLLPFTPKARARGLINTRTVSAPGIQTSTSSGFSSSNYAGGNAVITASALVGPYDNANSPNGGYDLIPGTYGNEQYGVSAYTAYGAPYGWSWIFGWTTGLPDNVIVPDGPVGVQRAGAPALHYVGMTLSFPSPPNAQLPITTDPISGIQNNFEVNNLNTFFTVSGDGTPTIS